MEIIRLAHEEIVFLYKAARLNVYVNNASARRFVLGPYADPHNKPAEYLWSSAAFLLTFILPVPLLIFKGLIWAGGSLAIGLMVWSAERKSSNEFVLQNMMEDAKFMRFILFNKGAKITDLDGNPVELKV